MPLGCPLGEDRTTLPHFAPHSLPPMTVPLKKTARKKPIASCKTFRRKSWSCSIPYTNYEWYTVHTTIFIKKHFSTRCQQYTTIPIFTSFWLTLGNLFLHGGLKSSSSVNATQEALAASVAIVLRILGGHVNICILAAHPEHPIWLSHRSTSLAYFVWVNTKNGRPVFHVSSIWFFKQQLYGWSSQKPLKKAIASATSACDWPAPGTVRTRKQITIVGLSGSRNTKVENVHYKISMLPNWTTHLQKIELVNQVRQFPDHLALAPSSPCTIIPMCNLYQSQTIWCTILPEN